MLAGGSLNPAGGEGERREGGAGCPPPGTFLPALHCLIYPEWPRFGAEGTRGDQARWHAGLAADPGGRAPSSCSSPASSSSSSASSSSSPACSCPGHLWRWEHSAASGAGDGAGAKRARGAQGHTRRWQSPGGPRGSPAGWCEAEGPPRAEPSPKARSDSRTGVQAHAAARTFVCKPKCARAARHGGAMRVPAPPWHGVHAAGGHTRVRAPPCPPPPAPAPRPDAIAHSCPDLSLCLP